MGFWVDSIGKLKFIFLLTINIFSVFESLKSMIYATGLIIMFILFQRTTIFPDFPVNIWVASFMAYGFHGSTFLQPGVSPFTIQSNLNVLIKRHFGNFYMENMNRAF